MSWFWIVIEFPATLFESMILFSLFNIILIRSYNCRRVYLSLLFLHAIIISIAKLTIYDHIIITLLSLASSCVMIYYFYNGGIFIKVGLVIAFHALMMVSELDVFLLLSSYDRITAIVFSKLIIFIILIIFQQFSVIYHIKFSFRKFYPILILPVITIIITVSMQTFWRNEPFNAHYMLVGISLIGLLFSNLIVFDQYKRFIQEAEISSQIIQIKQSQTIQIENMKMMELHNQEVRITAHDLKNKLLPSILYLQQGKKEQCLDNLLQIVEALNDMQNISEITGSAMIDLILSYKMFKARASDIKVIVDSRLNEPIFIPDLDISVILGNAIDNAFEAVSEIDGKINKIINIQMRSGRGILSIRITNPVNQDASE